MLHLIRRYLPQILVGLVITSIMLVAYASAGFAYATSPKATWAADPLSISFVAITGSGSSSDSVTCSQNISGPTLRTLISNPTRMSLTALPSSFSCNSSPSTVTFKAQCLVTAAMCRGTYHGLVQIRDGYRDIPANLNIVITVT